MLAFFLQVLGLGQTWRGRGLDSSNACGYKANLIKSFLERYKEEKQQLVLYVDGYDVILAGSADDIVKRFEQSSSRIFFSAEYFSTPDAFLAEKYPKVNGPYRYLNAGGFIGYAADLYELFAQKPLADSDNDQRYFTSAYLNETLRLQMKFKLDTNCTLFQSLCGAEADYDIRSLDDDSQFINTIHQTTPVIIHGNGWAKRTLSAVGNYIAKSWTSSKGCLACAENQIDVVTQGIPHGDVLMGIFIEQPTPFIELFFDRLLNLSYPKSRIHLRIHNGVPYHARHVREFVSRLERMDIDCQVNENEMNIVGYKMSCPSSAKQARNLYRSVRIVGSVEEEVVLSKESKPTDFETLTPPEKVLPFNEAAARANIL